MYVHVRGTKLIDYYIHLFFYHCRNIKNAVIGNKAKKSSFIRLEVIPKVIELLVQDDTGIEFVVESVVLLGSLARGRKDVVFILVSS